MSRTTVEVVDALSSSMGSRAPEEEDDDDAAFLIKVDTRRCMMELVGKKGDGVQRFVHVRLIRFHTTRLSHRRVLFSTRCQLLRSE